MQYLYLSRTFSLASGPGGAVCRFVAQGDNSISGVLSGLDASSLPAGPVTVYLSSSLCPAVEINYPQGIGSWAERLMFARSMCARALGTEMNLTRVQMDPSMPGVAAPVAERDVQSLFTWAKATKRHVHSMRPLWSMAAGAAPLRRRNALALIEPEGVTVLSAPPDGPVRALTLPRSLDTGSDPAALVDRMESALQIAPASAVRLAFTGENGDSKPSQDAAPWLPAGWNT